MHSSDAQDQLGKGSFTTTVLARPDDDKVASALNPSDSQLQTLKADSPGKSNHVRVDIAGPEPGYVATPLLYLAMASTLLDDIRGKSGCVMPASMVGDDPALLEKLVRRMRDAGIFVQVSILSR